jgi:glycosyltransferase involved in cell wall biosynthesis
MTRVLVIAHNHPALHPGGTEIVAHDLFKAYKARPGVEALFLAAVNRLHREPRPGTMFQAIGDAPDEMLLWCGHFDRFNLSQIDHYGIMPELARFLENARPDVVHIHHVLLIGVEVIALIRRVLPRARILMTLHDYYPICAHDGLMMKVADGSRCEAASPQACHACFPDIAADRFLLRERYLRTFLDQVDLLTSPSEFLKSRYVGWGLASQRIVVVPNARPTVDPAPHRAAPDGRRNVFGYFGNLNRWKGIVPLLRAVKRLRDEVGPSFTLRLHGGAPFQSEAFTQEVDALCADLSDVVERLGPYRASDMPELMAQVDWALMPSTWWENAPLVIQEAFQHRRPLIVSGFGGMAEMVRDGVDGLHARPGDPADWARVMDRAISEQGLWETLVAGIAPQPELDTIAGRYLTLARDLPRPARAA